MVETGCSVGVFVRQERVRHLPQSCMAVEQHLEREKEREREREGGIDGGEGEGEDSGKQEAVVRGRDRRRRRGAGKNVESQTWASGFVAMLCWISGVSNP